MGLKDSIYYLIQTHMCSSKTKVTNVTKEPKTKVTKVIKEPKTKVTKVAKESKPQLRDLDKIINDPESYANEIEIKKLVSVLQKLSDYYYASDQSLVDDDTYDTMLDVLKDRDPENSYLFQTGVRNHQKKMYNCHLVCHLLTKLNQVKNLSQNGSVIIWDHIS